MNELLSIPSAARQIHVSREIIDEWLQDPNLKRITIGKSAQIRIRRQDLFDYLHYRADHWMDYQSQPDDWEAWDE